MKQNCNVNSLTACNCNWWILFSILVITAVTNWCERVLGWRVCDRARKPISKRTVQAYWVCLCVWCCTLYYVHNEAVADVWLEYVISFYFIYFSIFISKWVDFVFFLKMVQYTHGERHRETNRHATPFTKRKGVAINVYEISKLQLFKPTKNKSGTITHSNRCQSVGS